MVEYIPGMEADIDVPRQDVIDGGFERALKIDRALVAARLRVALAQAAIAAVRDVVLDAARIDDADTRERQALLAREERMLPDRAEP